MEVLGRCLQLGATVSVSHRTSKYESNRCAGLTDSLAKCLDLFSQINGVPNIQWLVLPKVVHGNNTKNEHDCVQL